MNVQMMMAGIAAAAMTASLATAGIGARIAPQATEGVSATAAAKPTSAKTKYCVVTSGTGSRMERKVCRTRSEWLAEGFDPLGEK